MSIPDAQWFYQQLPSGTVVHIFLMSRIRGAADAD
ncbi:hypothetical protein [Bifidobacterium longum]